MSFECLITYSIEEGKCGEIEGFIEVLLKIPHPVLLVRLCDEMISCPEEYYWVLSLNLNNEAALAR